MRQLRFVGLDEDGTTLVCADESGQEYLLPVDGRLRAAVRQDRTRLGQVEPGRESTLTPREIQARIRAGETAEQVATAAGVPVERVRRFEGPVLRERERMAQDARSARLRRSGEDPWPVLGELVDQRLLARSISPDSVDWDAWRRDDNTWTVVLRFRDGAALTTAQWSFAPLRRSVAPLDEIARTLSEEERPAPAPARSSGPTFGASPSGGPASEDDEVASAVAPAAVAGAAAAAVRPGEPGPLAPRGPAPLRVVAASPDDAPAALAGGAPQDYSGPFAPGTPAERRITPERRAGELERRGGAHPAPGVTSAPPPAPPREAPVEVSLTAANVTEVNLTEVHVAGAADPAGEGSVTEVNVSEVNVTDVEVATVDLTGAGGQAANAAETVPAEAVTREAPPAEAGAAEPAAARAASTKRRKKATVPTWDDIVFGSRPSP